MDTHGEDVVVAYYVKRDTFTYLLSRDFQERTTTVFLQDKSFGRACDATKRVLVLWHTFAHLLMGAIEQARMLDRVMDNKRH